MRRLLVNLACGLIVCGLTAKALAALGVPSDRQALWAVVRTCVADFKLTGAPYPCLRVDLTDGEERGWVVLRPPFGPRDMILAPTRRVVGVEDPWLQSPDAPNYFDAAWRALALLKDPNGRPPDRDGVALAVNSALTRHQDQLHIHMGCLAPAAKRAAQALAPMLTVGKWTRVGAVVPGSAFWGLRLARADLSNVEPFRLAAEALGDKVRNRARLVIAVAAVRNGEDDELLILASDAGASRSPAPVSAEALLDLTCSSGTTASGAN